MKKKTKILARVSSFILVLCLLLTHGSYVKIVKAATIGQQLNAPEDGWKRFDDTDKGFVYSEKVIPPTYSYDYKGTTSIIHSLNSTITFKFSGSKIRLLSRCFSTTGYSNNVNVSIDGKDKGSFSTVISTGMINQCLSLEATDLGNSIHSVVITNRNSGGQYYFDAIDIDSTGYLIDPSVISVNGITLDKTSLDMNVGDTTSLTATILPENAANKTVAWHSSDPSIVTVDANGKITAIKEGSVSITATPQDGTNISATCTVNVKTSDTGNGLLTITMTDGQLRTYDLKKPEIDAFITWYNNKSTGNGSATYSFNKTPTSAAYNKRTEYIIFDKISNFDIDEYKTTK